MKVIAKVKGREAVNDFFPRLTNRDIPVKMRVEMVKAAGEYGEKEDADQLVRLLDTERDWEAGCEIVKVIAKVKRREAVNDFLPRLTNGDIPVKMRVEMVKATGEYGEKEDADQLVRLLDTERDWEAGCEIVKVIAKVKGREAVNDFLPRLTNGNISLPSMRIEMVETIGEYGEKEDVDQLVHLLDTERDWGVGGKIMQAIGKIKGKDMVEYCAPLLTNRELPKEVHRELVRVMGENDGQEAAEKFIPMLCDSRIDYNVKDEMMNVIISKYGNKEDRDKLMLMSRCSGIDARLLSKMSKAMFSIKTIDDAMSTILNDDIQDVSIIRKAIKMIYTSNADNYISKLIPMFANKRFDLQCCKDMHQIIVKHGRKEDADTLVSMLDYKNIPEFACCWMIKTIGEIQGKEAVSHFMPLVANEEIGHDVRIEMTKVIRKYGDKKDADTLVPMLDKEEIDSDMREGIQEAIKEIRKRTQESGESSDAR